MSVLTAEQTAQYMAQVELVREAMTRLGRGAQQNAAFDIRVSPSLVSSILKGRYVDPDKLAQLSEWAQQQLAGLSAPTGT